MLLTTGLVSWHLADTHMTQMAMMNRQTVAMNQNCCQGIVPWMIGPTAN